MKYRLELLIQKPRAEVWKSFIDIEKAKRWQVSLQNAEILNGAVGKSGAELKWTYEERGREFSLIERVLRCDEPAQYESQFENEFATNIVNNRFDQQAENQTLWIVETTYLFKTLLMRIAGPLLKKNYVTRSRKEMERLKAAVEED